MKSVAPRATHRRLQRGLDGPPLDCGEVEVLLTGDAEVASELAMVAADVLLDIDVLRVGHHGSRTSTSQEFLDALKPEIWVISAGLNNQFGHPRHRSS